MSPRNPKTPRRSRTRIGRSTGTGDPFPVDVSDRGDEFLVSADLPGLRKQDLDVRVDADAVEIVADFGDEDEGAFHRRERTRGEVGRVVRLPEAIDEKHASASYDDGVLSVTLRKRDRSTRAPVE